MKKCLKPKNSSAGKTASRLGALAIKSHRRQVILVTAAAASVVLSAFMSAAQVEIKLKIQYHKIIKLYTWLQEPQLLISYLKNCF